MRELTDDERAILDFEGRWWKHMGAKDIDIREAFDCLPVLHYQAVNRLLDDPAALAYAPTTVRRLQRLRDRRRAARSAGASFA